MLSRANLVEITMSSGVFYAVLKASNKVFFIFRFVDFADESHIDTVVQNIRYFTIAV